MIKKREKFDFLILKNISRYSLRVYSRKENRGVVGLKVTIITVVRNNVKFIGDCIKSVIGQTYKDIEYVIIDKGSTDGTVDVIRKYRDKISVFVSEKDEGAYYALNKGLRIASGDIIGILHSDDVYENKNVIEKVVGIFRRSNSIQAVYADLVYVSKNDVNKAIRYWHSGEYDENSFVNGWMPPHPTLFIRKKVYDKFGVYNTSFKIYGRSFLKIFCRTRYFSDMKT